MTRVEWDSENTFGFPEPICRLFSDTAVVLDLNQASASRTHLRLDPVSIDSYVNMDNFITENSFELATLLNCCGDFLYDTCLNSIRLKVAPPPKHTHTTTPSLPETYGWCHRARAIYDLNNNTLKLFSRKIANDINDGSVLSRCSTAGLNSEMCHLLGIQPFIICC